MKKLFALLLVLCLLPHPVSAAPALEVAGKSALLMDITTGTVLYEKNAHERLPPASVTKIMTLLLIMEAIDGGDLDWEDTVTVSETAAAKGGSQVYLKVGETMSVRDMVKSIAVSSANDCACAMAELLAGSEGAFVEKMNRRAQELGMENTHFVNCTGLDDDPSAKDHRTTAYDIALMSRELMLHHPDIQTYTTIWMDSVRGGSFGLSNTNKLIRFYQGATGLKTGYTSQAGHCLSATARRGQMHLVAVVLGADSSAERFSACRTMLDYGFANFSLLSPQVGENRVPVRLGQEKTVRAVPGGDTNLLLEKGVKPQVKIELEESVPAPVSQGQALGTMTVYEGENILLQVPMVAEKSVLRLSFWDLFQMVLRRCAMAE